MNPKLFPALLFLATPVFAQIQINPVEIYEQDFNTLTVTPFFRPWTDNITLPGWYITEEVIGPGIIGGVDSWGTTDGQGDRAFGAAGAVNRSELIAVRFTNATPLDITGISVTFDGEQWSRSQSVIPAASTLRFEYQVFEANVGYEYKSTGWTSVPALDFVSPNFASTVPENLDGNAPANSVQDLHAYIDWLTVAPGQEIWFRWVSYEVPLGTPVHGLGIDNLRVSFSTVPEPAAFASLAGPLALAASALPRRRRRKIESPLLR